MFLRSWLSRVQADTIRSASFLFPMLLVSLIVFNPVMVADINPEGDAFPDALTSVGDSVHFYATRGGVKQFFVANEQGTMQLTSLPIGSGCFLYDQEPLIAVGSAVFFSINVQFMDPLGFYCGRQQIWRTDGTPSGTTLVKDFRSDVRALHVDGNGFYAISYAGVWYSDGSEAGTKLVQGDMMSYQYVPALGVLDGKFYFLAQDEWNDSNYELWRADAIRAEVVTNTVALDSYITAVVYQNNLYFSGNNGAVWRLSAGSDMPLLWRDGGTFNGYAARMYAHGDRLYIVDQDTSNGTQTLWRYDGAADKLDNIGTYTEIQSIAGLGDSVYFAGAQANGSQEIGVELLRLPISTTMPVSVSPDFGVNVGKDIQAITVVGNMLYMRVQAPNRVDTSQPDLLELWASDGSAEGTQRVMNIADAVGNWNARTCPCLAAAGGQLYFDRKDASVGIELWRLRYIEVNEWLHLPQIIH